MVEARDVRIDDLIAKGWERRSILDGPRLSEAVRMYEELGFEVRVEEVPTDLIDDPDVCASCVGGIVKVLFTRKRTDPVV
jgi:hypothetical protein